MDAALLWNTCNITQLPAATNLQMYTEMYEKHTSKSVMFRIQFLKF